MAEQLTTEQLGRFICRATYTIEPMLEALRQMAEDDNSDLLPWMVLGIVPRLQQLNGAIMAAGGGNCAAEDLRRTGLLMEGEASHG